MFDDQPLSDPLHYPNWFKLSFLDFPEDLADADANNRKLMVYFGQKYCAYCEALLEVNFGKPDIRDYTRANFDTLGLDIHGSRSVVDLNGNEMTEREFSERQQINFTPTLAFYTEREGEIFRLRGYYPPYKFRAALEYVADNHYQNETFAEYLARADVPLVFEDESLNFQEFFAAPPYALDRTRMPAQRPLLVLFEQPDCHACDVLHTGPLVQQAILERLKGFEVVQLNIWATTPVITPTGKKTSAREWASEMGLFYTPTLVFYDEQGCEILRVDSVIQFYRLMNVLDYVLTKAYREYPTFQSWRERGMPQ